MIASSVDYNTTSASPPTHGARTSDVSHNDLNLGDSMSEMSNSAVVGGDALRLHSSTTPHPSPHTPLFP